VLARVWIGAARLRRRIAPGRRPREELVAAHVRGRSFADVGCMWSVDGAIAFAAEAAGATAVTGVDLMAASAAYAAEHERRGSRVRFVQGDVHDPRTVEEVGVHDVVWCSGVVYHAPHPLLTIERLRALTGDLLILASETIPEVPGLPQACLFLPELPAATRRALTGGRGGVLEGLSTPFSRERSYANWYWGLSRSALCAMLAAEGMEVVEEHGDAFHATVLARPRGR
jgi:Methyltransferase domain